MYARRFYRQSPPPGYSGVAFAPTASENEAANTAAEGVSCAESKQKQGVNDKNPPTHSPSGAGVGATPYTTQGTPYMSQGAPHISQGGVGAGQDRDSSLPQNARHTRPPFSEMSSDRRNQPSSDPRDFTYAADRNGAATEGQISQEGDVMNPLVAAYYERRRAEALATESFCQEGEDESDGEDESESDGENVFLSDGKAVKETDTSAERAFTAEHAPAERASAAEHAPAAERVFTAEHAPVEAGERLLQRLFKTAFTLEELLLAGLTMLLASGDADDEALLLFGMALVLMGR